jgi:membrane protein
VEGHAATGGGAGTREVIGRVRHEARTAETRDVVRALIRTYRENDLLTYASAISFKVFFSLIPLLMFGFALLGFLSLQDAWQKDIAPEVQANVSGAVFKVANDTVTQILGSKQHLWISIGAVIAVWEISGGVRAVMQVFNRIYRVEETRPFWRRMRISFALAAVAGALLILTFVVLRFGPLLLTAMGANGFLVDLVSFVARWAIALALLLVVVGVMVRFAPDCRRPLHWVSFGALLVVFGWAVMSVGFYLYVTDIADYASIFGSLATIIVLLTYLYASAIVFLTGVQLDALVQDGIAHPGQSSEDRTTCEV